MRERVDGGQTPLIKASEFFFQSNEDGVCQGVAVTALQNYLEYGRPGIISFQNQMHRIKRDADKNFPLIKKTQKIFLSALPLGRVNAAPLIRTLRDIEYYQQPEYYRVDLGEYYTQEDITEISAKIASRHLKEKGGLIKTASWIQINDRLEVIKTLIGFVRVAKKHQRNVAILLSCNEHTIGLCYDDPSAQWILVDANSILHHPLIIVQAYNFEKISKKISFAFGCNKEYGIQFHLGIAFLELGIDLPNQLLKDFFSTKEFQEIALFTEKKLSYSSPQKVSPAHFAAKYNDESLLEKIQSIDEPDTLGCTPLFDAIDFNHPNIVSTLLERGADPNHEDENQEIPLMRATQCGRVNIIETLLTAGAPFDDEIQDILFINAIQHNHPHLIQYFVQKKGMDVNRINQFGTTALYIATLFNFEDCVLMLLRCGANPTAGSTYYRHGHKIVVRFLYQLKGLHYQRQHENLINRFLSKMKKECIKQPNRMITPYEVATALQHDEIAVILDSYTIAAENQAKKRKHSFLLFQPAVAGEKERNPELKLPLKKRRLG